MNIIIIGSGLGGLQSAYILAKEGHCVTVLEQNHTFGGCLQSFSRGSSVFETGFHYIGGLDEGQALHRIFSYFGLMDLPWQRLDLDCFDRVHIGDNSFNFAQGYDGFCASMSEQFPHQKDNIHRYVDMLRHVGDNIFSSLDPTNSNINSLFLRSAYDFLCETISDPLLRKVLSGTSLKMQLDAATLPLYVFAQINSSFIQSAWRLRGGGSQIADSLIDSIRSMGGTVRKNARVSRLIEADGRISHVEINNDELLAADMVISNAHPKETLSLLPESKLIRRSFRNRINALRESYGTFTVNVRLRPNSLRYDNFNSYCHSDNVDLWQYSPSVDVRQSLMAMAVPTHGGEYCESLDILCPMAFSQVERWHDSRYGHRPESYKAFKREQAERVLDFVSLSHPDLRNAIDRYYTSTPLSYEHYTTTHEGSSYGIIKDFNSPITTILSPKSPIANLLLTGQNLNIHGVLGTSMTSLVTAKSLGINVKL